MSLALYLSFLVTTLVLIFTPGPVNVLAMSQALAGGWRSALPCVWGASLAVLLQLVLTALCLSSVLMISLLALDVLRWLGAGYLAYLGWRQWQAPAPNANQPLPAPRQRFWRGFATSGLNPKTLLFFPALFPQFLRSNAVWSEAVQYLLLAISFLLLFSLGVALTAVCSAPLRGLLARRSRWQLYNRLMASVLVLMGGTLAILR